jgi:hypothetical protein
MARAPRSRDCQAPHFQAFKLQRATSRPSSEHHHHSQQTPLNHAAHLSSNAGRRQERWNVLILRAGLATISTGLECSQRGRRDEKHLGKSGQRLRDIFGCMEALVGVIFTVSASSWHLFFGRFAGAMWRHGRQWSHGLAFDFPLSSLSDPRP